MPKLGCDLTHFVKGARVSQSAVVKKYLCYICHLLMKYANSLHCWPYSFLWCPVDSVLDPDNRLHMTVEEQLKELLEKLDFVTSMRCSGARTRRIRLLRREINNIRYRQGQNPRQRLHNGHLKDDEEDEDEEEDDDKDVKTDNGLSSSDKGVWLQALTFQQYAIANAWTFKSLFFFNETSCEHELTEHCPQVIEPGSPPRTNPNHPTVSSLVSRGPQSLVSHGCLTTPLSQYTLCLHLSIHYFHGLTTLHWPRTVMPCHPTSD